METRHCRECARSFSITTDEASLRRAFAPKIGTTTITIPQPTCWGEFFPMCVSPHAYNTAIVNDYFPLDAAEAVKRGAKWYEAPEQESRDSAEAPDVVPNKESDYVGAIYRSAESKKVYKLVAPEVKFYKTQGMALPGISFFERHTARLNRRAPRKVWQRTCESCQKSVYSTFAPERSEIVFCTECFGQTVHS